MKTSKPLSNISLHNNRSTPLKINKFTQKFLILLYNLLLILLTISMQIY